MQGRGQRKYGGGGKKEWTCPAGINKSREAGLLIFITWNQTGLSLSCAQGNKRGRERGRDERNMKDSDKGSK